MLRHTINDPEASRGERPLDLGLVEQRDALAQHRTQGVVSRGRPGEIAQPLRRARQRVVGVNDVGGTLHLLAPGDAPLACGRSHVVVEGRRDARSADLPHQLFALGIVPSHHRVVVGV
jgi:hypothetical protein